MSLLSSDGEDQGFNADCVACCLGFPCDVINSTGAKLCPRTASLNEWETRFSNFEEIMASMYQYRVCGKFRSEYKLML